eukprot:22972-Eustigmatos_ZCMA.PRE.1
MENHEDHVMRIRWRILTPFSMNAIYCARVHVAGHLPLSTGLGAQTSDLEPLEMVSNRASTTARVLSRTKVHN